MLVLELSDNIYSVLIAFLEEKLSYEDREQKCLGVLTPEWIINFNGERRS